jgi:hypothetical protein
MQDRALLLVFFCRISNVSNPVDFFAWLLLKHTLMLLSSQYGGREIVYSYGQDFGT